MGRLSNQPIARGRDLQTAEKLPADFPIAAIPMALADHFTQHVTVRQAGQSEVVSLPAAKCRETSGPARLQAKCLDPRPKPFATSPCQIPVASVASVAVCPETGSVGGSASSTSAPSDDLARALPITMSVNTS